MLNNRIISRMAQVAKALCPANHDMRCCHVAFLIKKGRVFKIAFNAKKSHPSVLKFDYKRHQQHTTHAELAVCLKSGLDYLVDYKMLVLRINSQGKLTSSKPCVGCQSVIKQFGIEEVYFSGADGEIHDLNE